MEWTELKNTYESLFMVEGHKAFERAVGFLLATKKAKTNSEIAKRLGISASTLSMYMSGEKTVSKNVIDKLKVIYQIDLLNPLTYEDRRWMDTYLQGNYAPIPADQHLRVYFSLRQIINEQQQLIEGLRKTNTALRSLNGSLYDALLRYEDYIVEAQLKTSKG